MPITLVTGPVLEPVTLADAKAFCRVDSNDEDDLFALLIRAARVYAEGVQHRAYITRTLKLTTDQWENPFIIPLPPLQSVSSVKYLDVDGTQQTLAATVYSVGTTHEPGRVTLAFDQVYPTLRGVVDQIEITYLAGYGLTPETVPQTIRTAILMLVNDRWQQRETEVTGVSVATIPAVERLLAIDRVFGDL